jgi:beta-lactamase regulating signal transducer with metallopeptidase domain/HEAT repeat protein
MNPLAEHPPVVVAASWLLTYLLHSTVLLCAAWLLTRFVRDHAGRDALWKTALVGGVLTATLQVLGGVHVLGGRWELQALGAAEAPASPAAPSGDLATASGPELAAEPPASPADGAADPRAATPSPSPSTSSTQSATTGAETATASSDASGETGYGWPTVISALWAAVAVALLVRLKLRHDRLHRMLADRQPVTEGPLPGRLAEMRRNAGIWHPVFLSTAPGCPGPLALGTREICVPPRFLAELDDEEQRAALAHELAHVARRDPVWHLVAGVIEAIGFFQPLNRVARIRMREAAEYLADDWAVRQTGARLGLAKCLAQVASWVSPGTDAIPTGTLAMAEGGSPLLLRVQRLLDEPRDPAAGPPALRAAVVVALLAAVVAAAPAVTPLSAPHEHEAEGAAPTSPAPRSGETAADTLPRDPRVVRAPDAAAPLSTRWRSAHASAARAGEGRYWVAYATPGVLPAGTASISDSGPWDMRELRATPLSTLLGVEPTDAAGTPVLVLLRVLVTDGRPVVERVSVRSPGVGARFDGPVYFLGRASTDESLDWLTGAAAASRIADVRATMYEGVGLHPGPRVLPILRRAAERDGSAGVRRSAVEAAERQRGDDALAFLSGMAGDDGSADVRKQATESLGKLDHPRAPAVLRRLMAEGRGEEVRAQALESLTARGEFADGVALREVALRNRDSRLRRDATEQLEQLAPALALRVLREVVWATDDPQVARQAAESLGNLRSAAALEVLDDVVARHPMEDAVVQAVEAISGFPDGDALPRLRRIARTHPMEAAQREALDFLGGDRSRDDGDGEDGSGREEGPDPARDAPDGSRGRAPSDPAAGS